jgi:hypothetical protein
MSANGRRSREREVVAWIGRMGAVELGHIRRRFGVGRSVAYALVRRLVEAGLLERVATLPGDPTLIRATLNGLRYVHLPLPLAKVSAYQSDHWAACSSVALWAEERFGRDAVISERELRRLEAESERPIGSCVIGEHRNGHELLHRPDLLVTDNGSPIAIEVELTPKAPRRLEAIVRGFRRARHLERTIYVVGDGSTRRAVERAVEKVRAGERVVVHDLSDLE